MATLEVSVIGASGLPNKDGIFAGKSDPFCVVQLVRGDEVVNRFQTKTINNKLNPVWNHAEQIEEVLSGDILEFGIYDSDDFASDPLGTAEMRVEDINPYEQMTLKLETGKRGDAGILAIGIKVLQEEPMPVQNNGTATNGVSNGNGKIVPTPLEISILSAHGITTPDGLANAYVICFVPGQQNLGFHTSVVMNSLKPTWNHTSQIQGFCVGDALEFHVLDKDKQGRSEKDQLLGVAALSDVDFQELIRAGMIERSLKLHGQSTQGMLLVRASVLNAPAAAVAAPKAPSAVTPLAAPAGAAALAAAAVTAAAVARNYNGLGLTTAPVARNYSTATAAPVPKQPVAAPPVAPVAAPAPIVMPNRPTMTQGQYPASPAMPMPTRSIELASPAMATRSGMPMPDTAVDLQVDMIDVQRLQFPGNQQLYCSCRSFGPKIQENSFFTQAVSRESPTFHCTGQIAGFMNFSSSLEFELRTLDGSLIGRTQLTPEDFAQNPRGMEGEIPLESASGRAKALLSVKIHINPAAGNVAPGSFSTSQGQPVAQACNQGAGSMDLPVSTQYANGNLVGVSWQQPQPKQAQEVPRQYLKPRVWGVVDKSTAARASSPEAAPRAPSQSPSLTSLAGAPTAQPRQMPRTIEAPTPVGSMLSHQGSLSSLMSQPSLTQQQFMQGNGTGTGTPSVPMVPPIVVPAPVPYGFGRYAASREGSVYGGSAQHSVYGGPAPQSVYGGSMLNSRAGSGHGTPVMPPPMQRGYSVGSIQGGGCSLASVQPGSVPASPLQRHRVIDQSLGGYNQHASLTAAGSSMPQLIYRPNAGSAQAGSRSSSASRSTLPSKWENVFNQLDRNNTGTVSRDDLMTVVTGGRR